MIGGQTFRRSMAAVARTLPSIPRGSQPLILGPWLGEVGPELQYWIPFLNKLKQSGAFGNRRVIALSRGGVAEWYTHIAPEYIELYDLVNHEQLIALKQEKPTAKQFKWTTGERKVVAQAAERLGIKQYAVVHPLVMWRQLLTYFQEEHSLDWFLNKVEFEQFAAATIPASIQLPDNYVAVRFYTSELFPNTEQTRAFVDNTIQRLAQHHHVVVLDNAKPLDDHAVFPVPTGERITRIAIDDNLANNLSLQTAIIAQSNGLIATYGGLTILPALVGKPCIALLGAPLGKQASLHFRHEAVTQYLYQNIAQQPYQVLQLEAWQYLESLLS